MSQACRLYLDADGLSVWQTAKGQTEQIADFPETPAGRDAFSQFLKTAGARRFLLLVNRSEERYLGETMPPLGRHERRQLAETRSRRAFPETPWRCVNTGRVRRGQNTQITLMALNNSPSLATWIRHLADAGSALAGIYSFAQLLPALPTSANNTPRPVLFLSKHRRDCRLTLLEHGQPRAARWLAGDDPLAIDAACQQLLAQQAPGIDREIQPSLFIIGPPGWPEQPPIGESIDHLPIHGDAASLILALPDKRWPKCQFAPASTRAVARQQQLGRWYWRVTILVLACGLSLSLERLLERQALQKQAELEQMHLTRSQQALETALARIAPSGMSPSELLQFADDHQRLRQQHAGFADSLIALGRMLDQSPEIGLERIDWEIPAHQALTEAQGQLEILGSIQATDNEQAQRLLQGFQQSSDRQSMVLGHPQPTGVGEFRFSLQIARLPAT